MAKAKNNGKQFIILGALGIFGGFLMEFLQRALLPMAEFSKSNFYLILGSGALAIVYGISRLRAGSVVRGDVGVEDATELGDDAVPAQRGH